MKKKDFFKKADVSGNTIAKLSKGDNVTVEVWERICSALNCGIEDIMEIISCSEVLK